MSKRALVVDDSKSSRLFLGKLLGEQQLQVDEAESAEAAIEYLGRNKPDVIFMDHLMPGMDGFQAVQAIKANPRTAQIPILMYTSQEGELYLGQAQALGAAGIVAKGATEAGALASVLESLWTAPAMASAIVVDAPADTAVTAGSPAMPPAAAPAIAAAPPEAWRSELALLREQITTSLHAQRTAVAADLRSLLHEARAAEAPLASRPDEPRHSPVPWVLAVLAAGAAAVFGTLYWQGDQQREALRVELADSREAVALLTARLAPPPEVPEPAIDAAAPAAADAAAPGGASPEAAGATVATPAPAATVLPAVAVAKPSAPVPVATPAASTTLAAGAE